MTDFEARRQKARERLDALFGAKGGAPNDRADWFGKVYETADGDAAQIPWADLAPKPQLADWLARHPGEGRSALDIACGLGDNAEALAAAGYRTTGFDVVPEAIQWATQRFPDSMVTYQVADLFDLPEGWIGGFDLVHECYTVQALHGALRSEAPAQIRSLVAPGGLLVLFNRIRFDEAPADGPPWPLSPSEMAIFAAPDFEILEERTIQVEKRDGRIIPHGWLVMRRRS